MARVQSIGAIATLSRLRPEEQQEDSLVNVHLRLYAKVDNGLLAIDPNPQTSVVGLARDGLGAIEEAVQFALWMPQTPTEHRQAQFARVIEELRVQHGVEIDAETLRSLPFELLPDAELRELIASD